MSIWQIILIDVGRIGLGLAYALTAIIDFRARRQLFQLMKVKQVPFPWIFYIGAMALKVVTGLLIVLNIYTVLAALILAAYVLIANVIFNNFWTMPKEQREFSSFLFLVYMTSCFGLLVIAGVG